VWFLCGEREVVGFSVEGRASRCLAVYQVGQLYESRPVRNQPCILTGSNEWKQAPKLDVCTHMLLYVPFGPEIIVDPRSRLRSRVDEKEMLGGHLDRSRKLASVRSEEFSQ
jgi:hypothetical protein